MSTLSTLSLSTFHCQHCCYLLCHCPHCHCLHCLCLLFHCLNCHCIRAGSSLIGFLSKSLVFCEKMSKWVIHSQSLIYLERSEQITHSRSFDISDLSNLLMVALLIWATWAICSQSLICPEPSEQITHSRSFDLSDLSKWANSQPCSGSASATLQIQ